MAVQALEEVQKYRALEKRLVEMFGAALSLETAIDELERQLKEPDNPHPINAKILTYEDAADWDVYRAIGTPEECRAAIEKQTAKKVISFVYHNGTINYGCPVCKRKIISKIDGEWCGGTFNEYCDRCGQKLDWRNEE